MINVILFQQESIKRIAERTERYFYNHSNVRIIETTVWVGSDYIKFSPLMITINQYSNYSVDVFDYLNNVLKGEEVYLSDGTNLGCYLERVNKTGLENSMLF